MTDSLTKYYEATGREGRLRWEANQASKERAAALLEMHEAGMSFGQIADLIGTISRSRVQQLIERGRLP